MLNKKKNWNLSNRKNQRRKLQELIQVKWSAAFKTYWSVWDWMDFVCSQCIVLHYYAYDYCISFHAKFTRIYRFSLLAHSGCYIKCHGLVLWNSEIRQRLCLFWFFAVCGIMLCKHISACLDSNMNPLAWILRSNDRVCLLRLRCVALYAVRRVIAVPCLYLCIRWLAVVAGKRAKNEA